MFSPNFSRCIFPPRRCAKPVVVVIKSYDHNCYSRIGLAQQKASADNQQPNTKVPYARRTRRTLALFKGERKTPPACRATESGISLGTETSLSDLANRSHRSGRSQVRSGKKKPGATFAGATGRRDYGGLYAVTRWLQALVRHSAEESVLLLEAFCARIETKHELRKWNRVLERECET